MVHGVDLSQLVMVLEILVDLVEVALLQQNQKELVFLEKEMMVGKQFFLEM